MKFSIVILMMLSSVCVAQITTPEQALDKTIAFAKNIQPEPIRRAAVAQNGRIKPMATFAREMSL
ncbi:MAG: hypothetical protein AB7H97_16410, partial [Pseudobdellovibrionaceae bacterium]